MKKIVLTFGLISGVIISVLMGGSLLLADKIGSGHSMALGYTIMVASFLLIYFGIPTSPPNLPSARPPPRRSLTPQLPPSCYVPVGAAPFLNSIPPFMHSYSPAKIHKPHPPALAPAPPAARVAAVQRSQQLYQNPFVN